MAPSSVLSAISSAEKPASIPAIRSREQEHWSRTSRGAEDADAALVEQAVEEALDRDRRIGQLVVLDRADQRLRLDPGVVLARRRRSPAPSGTSPPGRSAWRMRSGASGRNWTRRPPARQRMAKRAALADMHLGDGEADARRDLLGLAEIGVGDLLEAVALERDDALVAAGVRRPGRRSWRACPCRGARPGRVAPSASAGGDAGRRRSGHRRGRRRWCGSRRPACRPAPSVSVCRMNLPSNFSDEPRSTASTIASPRSFETGGG